MRKRFAPFLIGFVIALALSVSFLSPSVHAQALEDTSGVLSGVVANGTHGNAPVAGQSVTLQVYTSHATAQTLGQTTTDQSGHFVFTGLDGSGGTPYALVTQFQNGSFGSGVISFDNGPTKQVNLTVYDTTSQDSALSISLTSILFSEPDKQTGTIPVGEFFTFDNSGNTAYVASAAPANGMPMGLLRFALPANATNLTLGAGFAGVQAGQVNNVLGAAATIPPGKSQFAFSFDVPYSNTQYAFQFKTEYPTTQIAALVPVDVMADTHDLSAQQPVTAMGQRYQLLTRDAVPAQTQVGMRLWNLPVPGEAPDLDFGQLVAVGAGLVVLLALLLGLYVKRGDLAAALRFVAEPAHDATHRPSSEAAAQELGSERQRLLDELLTLENAHAAGNVSAAAYRQQRQDLRDRLKALLAASVAAPGTVAETPDMTGSHGQLAEHAATDAVAIEAEASTGDQLVSGGRS